MDAAALLVRVVLAGVFGLAAVTKLIDLSGSRSAMEGFGLPKRLAAPAGIALPLIEITIAILLLPLTTSWWGALGGLVLMLAFMAGIAYNLAKGRTPDCHCFGQVYSEPVGKSTLIRNGVFAALAAVLVLRGPEGQGASLVGWLGDVSTADRVLLILVVLILGILATLGWLTVQLLQQNGRLLVRIDALEGASTGGQIVGAAAERADPIPAGLPVGTNAPAFSLARLDGETVTLDSLRAEGKPVVLVFTDPGCGPCGALMPELGRWQQEHAQVLTLALVSRGTREANAAKAGEHGISRVFLQQDREVSQAYQSVPTPSAVLIRADGTIGAPAALGSDAIRSLITRITARPAPLHPSSPNGNGLAPARPVSKVGQPAPVVTLTDLDGKAVSLEEFQGDPTLVLFWNPGCGFCSRMLDDLKAWEATPPTGAPRLLVISTGTVEANQAMGLQSTLVLDQGFATGRAFGAGGTPSAVLVDADGLISSEVAVGAPAVLALADASAEHAGSAT
ncbi:MAG: redoxin domain-containing protein [Chloroflexota bacterium]|nr:redoxin domain-containing protein [Chloroflexota bacterium]